MTLSDNHLFSQRDISGEIMLSQRFISINIMFCQRDISVNKLFSQRYISVNIIFSQRDISVNIIVSQRDISVNIISLICISSSLQITKIMKNTPLLQYFTILVHTSFWECFFFYDIAIWEDVKTFSRSARG